MLQKKRMRELRFFIRPYQQQLQQQQLQQQQLQQQQLQQSFDKLSNDFNKLVTEMASIKKIVKDAAERMRELQFSSQPHLPQQQLQQQFDKLSNDKLVTEMVSIKIEKLSD